MPPPTNAQDALRALDAAWRTLASLDIDLATLGVWLGASQVRWRTRAPPSGPDWMVAYH